MDTNNVAAWGAVRDMVTAGRGAIDLLAGKDRDDLARDRRLTEAICQALMVLGRESFNVPDQIRALYPQVNWGQVPRLTVAHLDPTTQTINLDGLLATLKVDVPALLDILEAELIDPEFFTS